MSTIALLEAGGKNPESAHHIELLLALAALAADEQAWAFCAELREQLQALGHVSPELTFNLALQLERTGHQQEAVKLYLEAIQERPEFPAALVNLGNLLDHWGDRDHAVRCWLRALQLQPDLAIGYFG